MSRIGAWAERFSLPLLTKDLIQASQRKRTYVIRWTYAMAVCALGLWIFYEFTSEYAMYGLSYALGAGREKFYSFIWVQALCLYVFVPLLMAGTIFEERQRGTLADLLISPMSARRLLVEKYLAGMLPAVFFLLIAAPLSALLMGMGGVSMGDIQFGYGGLLWLIITLGGVTLSLSVTQSSMSGILFSAYMTLPLVSMMLGLLASCVFSGFFFMADEPEWLLYPMGLVYPPIYLNEMLIMPEVVGGVLRHVLFWSVLVGHAVVWLAYSRFYIWRRIEIKEKKSAGRQLFDIGRTAGRLWKVLVSSRHVNKASAGMEATATATRQSSMSGRMVHAVFGERAEEMPNGRGVAWRASRKFGLHCWPGALLVFLLMLIIPGFSLFIDFLIESRPGKQGEVHGLIAVFAIFFAGIGIALTASTVYMEEVRRQTLPALSVVPMSDVRLAWDKLAGVRRMIYLLVGALLVNYLLEAQSEQVLLFGKAHRIYQREFYFEAWHYVLYATAYVLLMSMAMMMIGAALAAIRRGKGAAFAAGLIVFAWMFGPMMLGSYMEDSIFWEPPAWFYASPLSFLFMLSNTTVKSAVDMPSMSAVMAWGFGTPLVLLTVCGLVWHQLAWRLVGRVRGGSNRDADEVVLSVGGAE